MLVLTGLNTVAAIDGWIERTINDINAAHGVASTQNYGDSDEDEDSISWVSSIDLIELSEDDE